MLKQVVPVRDAGLPLHETGEVAIVRFTNYLEAGLECQPKERPAIILASGSPQHWICGLTSKAHCLHSGEARIELPDPGSLGIHGKRKSFIWSPRAARLCRLDVLYHVGWINLDTVEVLQRSMYLPRWMLVGLIRAAATAHRTTANPR